MNTELLHPHSTRGERMTPTEIDHALALAIGYRDDHIWVDSRCECIRVARPKLITDILMGFETFDHQDPTVIYPLIEHYKLMLTPFNGVWLVNGRYHKSLATAIALCVIELERKK